MKDACQPYPMKATFYSDFRILQLQVFSSNSKPMYVFIHATAVVPEPINGSSIILAFGKHCKISTTIPNNYSYKNSYYNSNN